VIDVVGLTQHYGVRPVLRDINLHIDRGELVVIVGPNGIGKSTLLAAMGGVLAPQKGYVAIDGKSRRQSEDDELAIRRMAVYLPDQAWLPARKTGREYLLAVGRLYGVQDDALFDQIERVLKLFDLTAIGDSSFGSYSAGQRKKAALSAALLTGAPVLLLDEPFSGGLDPAGLLALKRVLQRRVAEDGATIVLTSPVPEIVEEIAGRIVILRDGSVAAFDTLDGLRRMTGVQGSLGAVLEKLLYPDIAGKLQNYFEKRQES
jgi:ABC-type multidrug transport system ATPase subunit